ncbi:MAG: multifunctional CCA addition/repair protein [Anaerolineaceae bacterium]
MKTYLVGGAVRDYLLGHEIKDRDYVVVGSTPEDMVSRGFRQVGADFPVFLHPETGEEYALARRERKTGSGYLGFETDFSPEVTLEEDLARRDLTINAMAIAEDGSHLVDPHGGQDDLRNKVFRHTSDAFAEDPVRVLRLARFRARYGPEWTVDHKTVALISSMAKKGVLGELVPERIWKELSRALLETTPRLFFDTLLETDALHVIFPEIYRLKTALEAHRWHPEGDAFEHVMLVLEQMKMLLNGWGTEDEKLQCMLAALVHDFGKGITPRNLLPKHHGHDIKGVPIVEAFCDRLTVPTQFRKRVMLTTKFHMRGHDFPKLNAKTVEKILTELNVRQDDWIATLLYYVFVADTRGRLGYEQEDITHLGEFLISVKAYNSVKFADIFPSGETNPNKIREGLRKARIGAIMKAQTKWRNVNADVSLEE